MNLIETGAGVVTLAILGGSVFLVARDPSEPLMWLAPWGAAMVGILIGEIYASAEARRGNESAVAHIEVRRRSGWWFLLVMSVFLTPVVLVTTLASDIDIWRARRSRARGTRGSG